MQKTKQTIWFNHSGKSCSFVITWNFSFYFLPPFFFENGTRKIRRILPPVRRSTLWSPSRADYSWWTVHCWVPVGIYYKFRIDSRFVTTLRSPWGCNRRVRANTTCRSYSCHWHVVASGWYNVSKLVVMQDWTERNKNFNKELAVM